MHKNSLGREAEMQIPRSVSEMLVHSIWCRLWNLHFYKHVKLLLYLWSSNFRLSVLEKRISFLILCQGCVELQRKCFCVSAQLELADSILLKLRPRLKEQILEFNLWLIINERASEETFLLRHLSGENVYILQEGWDLEPQRQHLGCRGGKLILSSPWKDLFAFQIVRVKTQKAKYYGESGCRCPI